MSKNNVSVIDTDLDKRLKETESCYNFEKLNYKTGLLDETVDATYIIHLEGNGRYDNILNQLEEYKPTQTVYILLNKGFKCSNPEEVGLTKFTNTFGSEIYRTKR